MFEASRTRNEYYIERTTYGHQKFDLHNYTANNTIISIIARAEIVTMKNGNHQRKSRAVLAFVLQHNILIYDAVNVTLFIVLPYVTKIHEPPPPKRNKR